MLHFSVILLFFNHFHFVFDHHWVHMILLSVNYASKVLFPKRRKRETEREKGRKGKSELGYKAE